MKFQSDENEGEQGETNYADMNPPCLSICISTVTDLSNINILDFDEKFDPFSWGFWSR